MQESLEDRAEKFQRLIMGSLLFLSYILDFIPIVIFVAFVMITGCIFTAKYTPFYQAFIRLSKERSTPGTGCECDCTANRFACFLGFLFLAASVVLFTLGVKNIAWALVLIVGSISILAGTLGFCLGTALYVLIFRPQKHS